MRSVAPKLRPHDQPIDVRRLSMATIEQSIEVNAPLRAVYNQWTQFEEFPHFMEGVKQVTQLDDKRLHWRAAIGGKEKEGVVEIVADALGVVKARVKGDLERFKEFIERRGRETGAWRGEIEHGEVRQRKVS